MQENVKEKSEKEAKAREDGTVWRGRLRRCAAEVAWGGCAYLLGQAQLLFGTYPLGLALLCASGKHTLSILVGLILSALFGGGEYPVVFICTYVAAAVVRVASAMILESPEGAMELPALLGRKLRGGEEGSNTTDDPQKPQSAWRAILKVIFHESLRLRMLSAAVCSFIVSLYRIIAGGFQYYDLFAAIFALIVAPAAVVVYSVSLESRVEARVLRGVSCAAILFSLVWAANGLAVLGVSVAVALALFFALYVTATEGAMLGAATGVLVGVAYDPIHAPAFLLAALVYAVFRGLRREGVGVLLSVVAMLAWSVYVGGAAVLIPLLPSALLGGMALTLVLKIRGAVAQEETAEPSSAEVLRHKLEGERHKASGDRFRGISDAFSSLSEMFYNLSDRFKRPGTLDLRRICDSSFDAFCPDCPNKTVCWGLEYSSTLGTVNSLISALHTKGKVTRAQIPNALSHRCDTVDAILERINRECAKLTGEMLRNNRTEIFAMDYEAAASIINDALEEDDGEYRFDPEQEQKITEYLADAGVRAHSVTVYGNRRRQILVRGVDVEQARVTVETMRSDLGEMCGMELGCPTFEVEGNVSTMTLQARKKIAVSGAQNNVSADGGVSGDAVNLFSNKKDYFYALISDGMGAGKEAALTSNLCSVFLEKMLRAGNRAGTSLRMLNNMIRSRGADSTRECSSTVDLVEVDLMTGEASFIKSGAAPSFVVRGKVVHRLQSGTAPIGIICALDVQATPFRLKAGDTIVMISDGILQNDPDCQAITAYLGGVSHLTPEEIVYNICLQAAQNENHDDCSAIALRIQAAE